MSVTLYATGLELTDGQAARLDTYSEALWLSVYQEEHAGEDPPGWPDPAGHLALAEWTVVQVVTRMVLQWERKEARRAIAVDPW